MSKILGVISEYNPMHNGHVYQLKESKKIVNPDFSVCIMSGNFMERGDTAIISKWARTKAALENGFDMVIELPTIYSISSAENFASGAVKILNSLNSDVTLSFGSECGDIEVLNSFAKILLEEPPEYITMLQHELAKGLPFPKARENALLLYLNDIRKSAHVLSEPNNILGIEYLKQIQKTKNKINAITIKRVGTGYNNLDVAGEFASATAIRELLTQQKSVKKFMPASSYEILKEECAVGNFVLALSEFEKEIIYRIRSMTISELSNVPDVSEGLEHKIKNAADSCNKLDDLIFMIKSKRYTLTRIHRVLLYILLGITKDDYSNSKKVTPYIRVLGVSNYGKTLLSELSLEKKLNVITSVKDFLNKNNNRILNNMLIKDIHASNIYTLAYKKNSTANLDFTQKLITL